MTAIAPVLRPDLGLAASSAESASSPVDDSEGLGRVIRRAQAGDDTAFGTLYRVCRGRIFALCLRLEGDSVRAEELVQDVFVQAWKRLRTFRGESRFSTWLHRLAVNVVLQDRRATWRRERRVFLGDDAGLPEQGEAPKPATMLDLETALRRLPAGARAVFVLHDVEGYHHSEIAELLGVAEGTSKAQLFRARRLLREALSR